MTAGCLGMGNDGAVFQLVPQRFASRMGIVTGVVGPAGGLGGFFLPSILGAVRDATGTYAIGLSGIFPYRKKVRLAATESRTAGLQTCTTSDPAT